MTRPQRIPPPGTPLTGLSPLLAEIATAANREDTPHSGIFGRDGTATAPPPQCAIALFLTSGTWVQSNPSPAWPYAPNANWYMTTGTRIEYYGSNASPANNWATPAQQSDTATTPETACIWAPAEFVQTNIHAEVNEPVWCFYDEGPGCWVVLARAPATFAYAYLSAYGQYINASGGTLVQMDLSGASPTIEAGDGTTGVAVPTIPGTYLAIAELSVGPGLTGSGTIDAPPIVEFTAAITKTGGFSIDAISHFHCQTDPANTDTPWVTGTGDSLPPLPAANGSVTLFTRFTVAAGDQIGVTVQCGYNVEVNRGYLYLIRIGP